MTNDDAVFLHGTADNAALMALGAAGTRALELRHAPTENLPAGRRCAVLGYVYVAPTGRALVIRENVRMPGLPTWAWRAFPVADALVWCRDHRKQPLAVFGADLNAAVDAGDTILTVPDAEVTILHRVE